MSSGVSIVICCHNSAKRIARTLRHLQRQEPGEVPWEVILVDNVCTDATAAIASEEWAKNPITNYRVVDEDRLGLSLARETGIEAANFEVVSFIDDDNWVSPFWVASVSRIFNCEPDVGAAGGPVVAEFECTPPEWFGQFERSFAVGSRSSQQEYLTSNHEVLAGAGLSIRKSAWSSLKDHGFGFSLTGRTGKNLLSSEDVELCLALRLAGWKLKYDSTLELRHLMPKARLNWRYLRRLQRAVGYSYAYLIPYYSLANGEEGLPEQIWRTHTGRELRRLWGMRRVIAQSCFSSLEGQQSILQLERSIGLCFSLLRNRSPLIEMLRELRTAAWIRQ